MKKIAAGMLTLLCVCLSVIPVCAAEKVQFSIEDTTTKNNRIFTLSVYGQGEERLSCASFEFSYDSQIFFFREARAVDENATVKVKEQDGKLSLIFLHPKGVDLSENPELFQLDFKAEQLENDSAVLFLPSDCVNADVQSFEAEGGSCTVSLFENQTAKSVTKTVKSSSGTAKENKTARTSVSKTSGGQSGGEETQPAYNAELRPEKVEASGVQKELLVVGAKDNTWVLLTAGAAFMTVLLIVCAVAYRIGRSQKKPEEEKQKNKKE